MIILPDVTGLNAIVADRPILRRVAPLFAGQVAPESGDPDDDRPGRGDLGPRQSEQRRPHERAHCPDRNQAGGSMSVRSPTSVAVNAGSSPTESPAWLVTIRALGNVRSDDPAVRSDAHGIAVPVIPWD